MIRRVLLFVVTNLAVMVTLGVALNVLTALGVLPRGQSFGGLLVMAIVVGFFGSFVSLALSKVMAKWSTGAKIIDRPTNTTEQWLLATVEKLAHQSGIGMPDVAIFPSPVPNAFATGMRRNSALVAVSSGLLQTMREDEVEGVLGHEIAHVANGDMVTLTLIQGVLNTFVFFFSRVAGMVVDSFLSRGRDEEGGHARGPGYWIATIVAELVLGILATMIVMWFSRYREFRADAGGAKLAGHDKMIRALERLRAAHEETELPGSLRAFGIRGGGAGFLGLFRSHPPLEERIARLRAEVGPARFDR